MRAKIFQALFVLWIIALIFLIFAPKPAQAAPLILNNSPIVDLSKWVSSQTGKTITFADSPNVPVSINIPDSSTVDAWAVFESAVAAAGLHINQVDSIYVVSSKQISPQIDQEPFNYPINTYKFDVYPTNLNDIFSAMNQLLPVWHAEEQLKEARQLPSFKAQKSANQSALLLSIPPRLKREAKTLINALNKPPKQILVEAIVFETTNLEFEAVGIDFRDLAEDGLSIDFGVTTGPLSVVGNGFGISYSKDGDIKSVLRALDTNDSTTILSTPELRIMDRQVGRVKVGQEVPFITSTKTSENGQVTNTVVRQTVGLNFSVKPIVQSDNSIRIDFTTSVGSLTGDSTAADVITSNRSVKTVVTALDGELVYLGGLITEEFQDSLVTVPGLSNLPIIGGLFASDEARKNRTKLAVFLKTTII